jgi:site-specific recombinase XerD
MIAGFLDYLSERGCSKETIVSYEFDLKRFASSAKKDLAHVTPDDIRAFIVERLGVVSASTASRQLYALRCFYSYLLDEELITVNPAHRIAAIKVPLPVVLAPTLQEVESMIESVTLAGTKKEIAVGLRNRAIILTVYGSGLRVSEVITLKIADIDFSRNVIAVRLGKGKKDRLTPMNNREAAALIDWLRQGWPVVATECSGNLAFIGTKGRGGKGQPLTRQAIVMMLKSVSLRSVGRLVSPHKLRHAFCTDLVNGGADVRVVQTMMGHADLGSTQRYMHSNIEHTQEQYMQFHPRGNECTTK